MPGILGIMLMTIWRDVGGAVRWIPGVKLAEGLIRDAERVVLRELSQRIEQATGEFDAVPAEHAGAGGPVSGPERPPTPAERLDRLLRTSMDQTPQESHESLVDVVLDGIVPDEARILSALSDGSAYLVIHVEAGALGRTPRRILSNASDVGRAAGVALPDRVPAYLSHLESLGLIEFGPEDGTRPDEYEILLTDARIRQARNSVNGARVRFPRQTVRITDLGRDFWHTCRPE